MPALVRGGGGAAGRRTRRLPAVKYRLSADAGWAVVEEYELNRGTDAQSSYAIAAYFCSIGTPMSNTFVLKTLQLIENT